MLSSHPQKVVLRGARTEGIRSPPRGAVKILQTVETEGLKRNRSTNQVLRARLPHVTRPLYIG